MVKRVVRGYGVVVKPHRPLPEVAPTPEVVPCDSSLTDRFLSPAESTSDRVVNDFVSFHQHRNPTAEGQHFVF